MTSNSQFQRIDSQRMEHSDQVLGDLGSANRFKPDSILSSCLHPVSEADIDEVSGLRMQQLLNLGCGRQFHPAWVNIDLSPIDKSVLAIDISQGLPFPDNCFDAIYHSHLLEHLDPNQGKRLIEDCFRSLKPGGILRIVVPDLEQIATLYLEFHQRAVAGDEIAAANYRWMKLELIDQMVRRQSGGAMGQYISDSQAPNLNFVRQRIGDEIQNCLLQEPTGFDAAADDEKHNDAKSSSQPLQTSEGSFWYRIRLQLTMWLVRRILGRSARQALQEGLFRAKGEVHRWMYDRFSLFELCLQLGFEDPHVCHASESRIKDFADYQLDMEGDRVRKPDSIFFECRKPLSGERV